jgi:hypothetical protein
LRPLYSRLILLTLFLRIFNYLSDFFIDVAQFTLQIGDALLQVLLLEHDGAGGAVELVEGESQHDEVEQPLVEKLNALLQQHFILQLGHMALLGGLEDAVVDPVLESMRTATHSHEEAGESGGGLLYLLSLDVAQHRPREGADQQREYLLEGEHAIHN